MLVILKLDPAIVGVVSMISFNWKIRLPPEIVAYIWSFLTLKELVNFGGTSRLNRKLVFSALRNTVYRLIEPFTPNRGVNGLLSTLKAERAVISGSMALYPLLFCNFSGTNSGDLYWKPHDMDIYKPQFGQNHESGVLKYLQEAEGFMVVKTNTLTLREQYDTPSSISGIKSVVRGDLRVDVVTSSGSSAIAPIFKFHSTPVFNWISPQGFFSAYPSLTCIRRGLLNPMALSRGRFVPDLPSTATRSSLDKYCERGFDVRRNPSCWQDDRHKCTLSAECPISSRCVVDGGCLFMPFEEVVGRMEVPYDSQYILFWYLGGPPCDGRRRVCDGYVSLRADAEDERFMR